MDSSPNICFLWQGRWLKWFPNRVSKNYSEQNTLGYFIFLYFHTHTSSKPTVPSFNRSNQITRMQKPKKSRRRWEAEGLWRGKSAGLEEFEPKLTSQRKFPRESFLCCYLPTWNSSMFWQKEKKIPAAQQQNRYTEKSIYTKLKVQKKNNYSGI